MDTIWRSPGLAPIQAERDFSRPRAVVVVSVVFVIAFVIAVVVVGRGRARGRRVVVVVVGAVVESEGKVNNK